MEATEYAYQKGLEMDLNPDYRMVESEITIFNKNLKAAIWVNFKENGMFSKFTLEDASNNIIFERNISGTQKGVEFFLVAHQLGEWAGSFEYTFKRMLNPAPFRVGGY